MLLTTSRDRVSMDLYKHGGYMYSFVSENEEKTIETLEGLVNSILEMEQLGDITNDDLDECLYYLRKVSEITGVDIKYDDYLDE